MQKFHFDRELLQPSVLKNTRGGYTPKEIHKGTSEYINRCTCNNRLITYNGLNKYKTIKKYGNVDSTEVRKVLWMHFLGRLGWNKSGLIYGQTIGN